MTEYVALLRAVNVGGRQIKMADLKAIGEELGLDQVRTYIASGNLLFVSGKSEKALAAALSEAITKHLGKTVEVLVRTAAEMAAVVKDSPFAVEPGNRVAAIFLEDPPTEHAIESARHVADERLALGRREIYVHYPNGMGRSKLQIPAAKGGTARNMNTVAKLAELAKGLT